MWCTQNFIPTPVDRKTRETCCAPPLYATSFEKSYTTTEELVCCAVSEERVCNNFTRSISQIISHVTIQQGETVQNARCTAVNRLFLR
jgi:hypothetical protein